MTGQYTYPGQELAFFEKASHWKNYFASVLQPYIGTEVLEVGSGIGATTTKLNTGAPSHWTLLEPDEALHAQLSKKLAREPGFANCILRKMTIAELPPQESFDTILYIDVLEHIEDDRKEMELATSQLKKNGHLLILSPAWNFLFSPFDRAIGHYRRYTARTLQEAMPSSLQPVKIGYLDSVGFFASLANKLLLQQKYPSEKQIKFWDSRMIPVSKRLDSLFFHSFGKSIFGVWKKT